MKNAKGSFEISASIKDESLLQKFTIVFFSLFFLPLMILFFLVHNLEISSSQLLSQYGLIIDNKIIDRLFLLFLLSSLVFFVWGRRIFISLMMIAKSAEEISKGKLNQRLDDKQENDREISALARSFNEITHKLEDNLERLKLSKRTIQEVLYRISTGITDSTKNMETFLRLILETTMSAIDSRRGALVLMKEDESALYIQCAQGYTEEALQKKIQPVSEEAWVVKTAKSLIVPRISADAEPAICVALKYKEKTIGALSFAGKIGGENFVEDDVMLLSNIATQTAVAIVNERLNLDAEQTYKQTVSALAVAVEARDTYSRGHSDRVAKYAMMVARTMNLDEKTLIMIQDAAELHDVGKIGIEDELLRKVGSLDEEEMKIMRKHPIIGESIVKPIHSLINLCDVIRHHHEFLDGTGYPDGLKGEEVSVGARILAVVDAFDAMTTDRPYRKAKTHEEAFVELRRFAGTHYDNRIVESFIGVLLKDKQA